MTRSSGSHQLLQAERVVDAGLFQSSTQDPAPRRPDRGAVAIAPAWLDQQADPMEMGLKWRFQDSAQSRTGACGQRFSANPTRRPQSSIRLSLQANATV